MSGSTRVAALAAGADPRPVPDLVRDLPEGFVREVAALAEEVFGHPITSVLTTLRPWSPESDRESESRAGNGIRYAARLEFGSTRASAVLAEYEGNERVYVGGAGGVQSVGSRHLRSTHTLRNALSPFPPASPAPATNEEVEDLTRLVYALPLETLEALTVGLSPERPLRFVVPFLPPEPGGAVLRESHLARGHSAALRALASGAPLEWALRRVEAGGR